MSRPGALGGVPVPTFVGTARRPGGARTCPGAVCTLCELGARPAPTFVAPAGNRRSPGRTGVAAPPRLRCVFYGEGEEGRLREAFGSGPVRVWKWWWEHRHRIGDWFLAVCAFPWTALFDIAPSGGLATGPTAVLVTLGGLPLPVQLGVGLVLGLVIPAGVSVLLVIRRSRPEWLLAVSAALLLLLGNPVPAMLALYTYASWFQDRRRLATWTVVIVVAGAVAFSLSNAPKTASVFFLLTGVALPLTLGLWVGTRRQLIGNLRERAARLEREQYLMADRAINAERTRIAREMHDVVAHRVSMMVLQAGGLEVNASDYRTAEVAGLIRTTGREALGELREILGVLRDSADGSGSGPDSAPTAPQPVLADLGRLVGEWRTAGMDVVWSSGGRVRPLPAQVERTAYRVVQEALTNAGRHAPGARVQVRVDYGESDLEVAVANEPPPPRTGGTPEPPMGGGYGLAGLHERVVLADGTLTAGPYPDGGWQVRAVLPLRGYDTPPEQEGAGQGPPEGPRPQPGGSPPQAPGEPGPRGGGPPGQGPQGSGTGGPGVQASDGPGVFGGRPSGREPWSAPGPGPFGHR